MPRYDLLCIKSQTCYSTSGINSGKRVMAFLPVQIKRLHGERHEVRRYQNAGHFYFRFIKINQHIRRMHVCVCVATSQGYLTHDQW